MSKTPLLILLFTLLLICLPPATFHAYASDSFTVDFKINQVDHIVQIQNGGSVIIKDIVNMSVRGESKNPQKFPLGFPSEYASHLAYSFAYSTSDPDERLEVTLDAGLGKIGFYGIGVTLPEDTINMDSYSFTVIFVLSDMINAEPFVFENLWWNLTFPIYPSLVQTAPICNVQVILPLDVGNVLVEWHSNLIDKGLNVSSTSVDSRQVLHFSKTELENFEDESAWVRFYQLLHAELDVFLLVSADEIRRDMTLDNWGDIFVSDFYHMTNKGEWNLTSVKLHLPKHAFDVSWIDEEGRVEPPLEGNATTDHVNATVSFRTALRKKDEAKFTLTYRLPWKEYITQETWHDFDLVYSFFEQEYFDWIIRELSVTINLPDNANFQSCSVLPRSVEDSIVFSFHNVTSFQDGDFLLSYEYVIFWASFYPTMWVGLSVAVLCIIAILWRVPKPPTVPVTPVSLEALKGFVDAYERRTGTIRELEVLEQKVQKRKIPRRQYRMRKKSLEDRLSVLSKDLANLKGEIRQAGSRYANIMRQIEVAETELEETEAAIRRIEVRYRRREISKGTYQKLLEGYNRRRERAETTIDGVLLRLREDIR
ncbi:MAG: hypothetical protein JSW53_04250 [Candidatus Bathyarchaeota archaeon]|nr:MAG: hypothetical protein JSW53_04250 [Candidatus Bathyarchaeota archaeon]